MAAFTDKNEILISDLSVVTFYKEHPSLNIAVINNVFIEIMKKLSTNLTETMASSTNQKILTMLTDLTRDMGGLKQDILLRLHDAKKEYIEDIKLILSNGNMTMTEKIHSIMERNNDTILTKTNMIVNEIVPKNNEKYYSQLDTAIKQMHQSMTEKLVEIVKEEDGKENDFESIMEAHFNKMIVNLQQPIFSFIQSSEERTTSNVQQMRDKLITQQTSQDCLNQEMRQFLNKYQNNSSSKGNVSETELYYLLQQIFPTDDVIRTSSETGSGDFIVHRTDSNKPSILFENKNYERKVSTDEVEKFERDVQNKQIHGIFLSQKSHITFKSEFKIDIIHGFIHIYLPNLQYNAEKVKVAVDIIDNLSTAMGVVKINETSVIHCSKEDVDELLDLYNYFIKQKAFLLDTLKMSHKQVIEKIEEMHLISVRKLLNKNGMCLEEDFKCKFCTFVGKNKGSVSAHLRTCKMNPDADKKNAGGL